MGLDDIVSLGVCCIDIDDESQAGTPSKLSPMQYEKPSWMVAGRGLMPWLTGVVHTPWGADIDSVFAGMLVPFMVRRGGGRGGGTSLLNLLLGLLKAKEGICICCRNWAWLESIAIKLYTRERVC